MLEKQRRIVTGHSSSGRSIVVIDGPPGNILGGGNRGQAIIWSTESVRVDSRDGTDMGAGKVLLSPKAGGSNFRYFSIPPMDPSISPEEQENRTAGFFEAMEASQVRVDTTRHPGMHKTDTIDYVILLSGEITLLLDDEERTLKPFDVVVQRGTNHAWVNKGKEPALLAGVLIDAEIE